jgi:hypothetical protein
MELDVDENAASDSFSLETEHDRRFTLRALPAPRPA